MHVDYSQKDFVVYLTEEGKLYGLGNDSTYMLLQHTEMPVEDLAYPTNGMSPVRHFCWKMSVMRGADVMM